MDPVVSVVIPVKDAEAWIGEQLAALAQQPCSDWELIIADNGSKDRTVSIAQSFADVLPLRVIDASAGTGPSAARNIGARAASASLLVFTDADDVVAPGWLATWVELPAHVGLATGPLFRFRSGDEVVFPGPGSGFDPPVHLGFLPYALGTNLAVRRELFEHIGGFDERYPTAEDIDLSWRLQLDGNELVVIPSAVVAVRKRDGAGATLRQYFRYGRSDPLLWREYRDRGLRRPPRWPTARSYLSIIARLPILFLRDRREAWLHQLGRRAGRLVGSVEARAFLA
jgi:glycosyltransferase involved in cell wall biosynthesis